jgi:hypothetical protein
MPRINVYLSEEDYALWLKLPEFYRSKFVADKLKEEFDKSNDKS